MNEKMAVVVGLKEALGTMYKEPENINKD